MKIAVTTEKFDIPLAFQSGKCDNIYATFLLVRDESAMGFMSGGMVADSVSEGFCNYLVAERWRSDVNHEEVTGTNVNNMLFYASVLGLVAMVLGSVLQPCCPAL